MVGRHIRNVYAEQLTRLHLSWLHRRDRNPMPWIIPIAVLTAFLTGS